ncbi:hypothetical protein TPHA_0I00760 [Tetrapisispora phaffii CBS 4417]|uniref:Ran GTPase-activating protein 1 n=1 Tax=Tetrapisispora phaffii (strain ATCC 24235 / CBS 4417 / NBRC 1672 / NRRL Y-8282 / UCD 70-5) TaxID=1071381 RepID=G8BXF4_TETPH|nr:hypothetical protein TPHA_0I00760 [Tetrapisispora phaffii CBS 4417]CCE64582.1 hypothetical protein TPHA_0I00760 [Tetrapisispora phaffii CBS 4417]
MATLNFTPVYNDGEVFSIAGQARKLTTKEDIQFILDDLSSLEKVSKLDVSGNTIGIEASQALARFIKENDHVKDNLKEVNFADLYTSRLVDEVVESLISLVPVFLACPQLEIINLSDNAFGLRTIDQLEELISNAINLKHLILSNNGMGPLAGERIGKALFNLAQNKKKNNKSLLETFICGRNRLENGSALFLAIGLKSHASDLKVVKLYQNGIRPKGVATLIHYGLKYNENLEIFDLQDNTFTATASTILAQVLPTWKHSLVELNLNDCLLKTEGSHSVFEVFQNHVFEKLTTLKFEYNEMGQSTLEDVFIPILQKGENLPKLKILKINGNRFEEDSEPLDLLQEFFDDELELDDLEEVDSEEESEDEEAGNEEIMEEHDIAALESELLALEIEDLTKELKDTHL